jgi:PAS domain S-box-containing protein
VFINFFKRIIVIKKSIAFLFALLLSLSIEAQEYLLLNPTKKLSQYPLKSWDMDKGTPSDMVIGLLQDDTGYIWLATYKGIARFDGVNFTVYNSITSDVIESVTSQALTKDTDGNLWFASQKGIVKYANNKFVRDPNLSKLNKVSVEALYYDDKTNSLWIGTTSEGIFQYTNGELIHLTDFFEYSRDVVKVLGADSSGNIWIGTEGGALVRFNGKAFSFVKSNQKLGAIGSLYSSNNGDFWVAAESGVFKLIENSLVLQNHIPVEKATVLFEDNHNTLWIGSENGLYRYYFASGLLDSLNESMGLPNDLIKDFIADNEGNLWVATYRKGIFKITDGLVTNFSHTEGLSSNLITAVAQFDENTLYVADEYGVINILKNDRISRLKTRSPLSGDRLKSIYIDSKRNLWISTYGGLLKVDTFGKESIIDLVQGSPIKTIRTVFQDGQDNIWIGTRSNGLFKLTPNGVIEEYSLKNGLSSNYIMSVSQDLTGRILVATKNGINIIENNRVEQVLNMDNGMPSNFAFNVHVDKDNVFWVASNDGIIRIENDKDIFVFNIENGLFDNTLFDILEDDFGFFWMPTDIGIVRISKDELNQFAKGKTDKYYYRIFGRNEGMKNPRCTGATKSIKTSDGRIVFTTSGGVSIVNPRDVIDEIVSPNVLIENMVVNSSIINPFDPFVVLPGNNRIQINYTAFNYKYSDKIKFRYKLEPFDNTWIEVENERVARYTNIPPGKFTFSVQSSIKEGEWCQKTSQVEIFVKRSWWQSWGFRLGVTLLFALILLGIYKARTYNVKIQNEELERLVKVRTALIAQQKVELENQSMELEKLSIVASHTNNAILITTPTAEILWVNQSFTRIYGYTLDEFVAQRGSNLKDLSGNENAQFIIDKCIRDQEPLNYTTEITTKNGATVWIQTSLTPVSNPDGSLRVIVVIDSDITDLKMVENEMIIMNDEIVKQADAILKQKEAIQSNRDELEQVNDLLIRHNQNLEASIWYAHTIQKAILPTKELIDSYFENFIVFKPRDIVSGDFYWFSSVPSENSQRCIIAVVDCTGHGVPGALMSMIGSRLLSEIISDSKVYDPAVILFQLNKLINFVLKQNSEENIDGMDVALCLIEKTETNTINLTYSGANRPLYILRNGSQTIETLKGNRKTIGGIIPDLDAEFKNQFISLNKNDMIFLSTDGYIDQNGPDGKKISTVRLQHMIIEKSSLSMQEIGEFLDISFDEFRGIEQQRDDVAIIGLRF